MSDKQIAVGDPVLFFGRKLVVTLVDKDRGVVKCCNEDEAEWKSLAANEKAVRSKPWRGLSAEETVAYFKELEAAQKAASEAVMRVSLRVDLLDWWEEQSCWVSDGRILTAEQIETCKERFGAKPTPSQHRTFYVMLEGKNG